MWYVVENYGTADELRHGPFKDKEDAHQWQRASWEEWQINQSEVIYYQ